MSSTKIGNKQQKLQYDTFHLRTTSQKFIISDGNFTYRLILNVLNTHLRRSKNVRDILDIGCGAGTLSLYLANKGYKVMGIDISQSAIEKCQESALMLSLKNNAQFAAMNFPNKIPNKKFDFILMTEVIEHIKDDRKAIKKILSLLRPGGYALITTPSLNAPLYRLGLTDKFDKEVGHLRRYNLEELKNDFINYGFVVIYTSRTEGVFRNFLFLNPVAGKSIRFIKYFLSDLVTYIDDVFLKIFGESNIFLLVRKS